MGTTYLNKYSSKTEYNTACIYIVATVMFIEYAGMHFIPK